MKRIISISLFHCIIISLFFVFVSSVYAVESIKSFSSDVVINQNGTVDVQETILYDFGSDQRHGIFRKIPYRYTNKDDKKYESGFQLESVTNELATPYIYSLSTEEDNKVTKIGDADKTIIG